jgi:hypothetical protein
MSLMSLAAFGSQAHQAHTILTITSRAAASSQKTDLHIGKMIHNPIRFIPWSLEYIYGKLSLLIFAILECQTNERMYT